MFKPIITYGPYAKNYTPTKGRKRRIIVLHTMEYPAGTRAAEWCGSYFAGRNAPRASSHYGVDSDSIREYVRRVNVAWCAPGANHDGIHIEMGGYAKTTRNQWLTGAPYSTLLNAARLVAYLCEDEDIPATHLSDSQLRNGARGIVDHHACTRVFKRGTHWDIGPGFPWDIFMDQVRKFMGTVDAPATPITEPPKGAAAAKPKVRPGDRGEAVREVQRRLNTGMVCDGIYERNGRTRQSIDLFQAAHKLERDGIVGPKTWKALMAPQIPITRPKLRRNSRGNSVAEWQRLMGMFTKNHVFGPQTDRITREFQRKNGLKVDGVVGSKTWTAANYRITNAR